MNRYLQLFALMVHLLKLLEQIVVPILGLTTVVAREEKSAGGLHAQVMEEDLLLLLHPRPLLLMEEDLLLLLHPRPLLLLEEEEDQIAQFVAMAIRVVRGRANQVESLKIVHALCELFSS